MNGKASELYSWGPPKLKNELHKILTKKSFILKIEMISYCLCPKILRNPKKTTEIQMTEFLDEIIDHGALCGEGEKGDATTP